MGHESFDRGEHPAHASDRSFGLALCGFLVLLGLWPLVHGRPGRWWALGLGVAVAGLALLRPALLAPLNRLANRFALLMQSIVNPVVMGVIFYGVITPLGILKRRVGQDLVRRGFDAAATSYWIERRPPGPRPETMNRQF
ncbi:MAG TPA: hypothetical protein VIG07_04605 [Methylomirabilota bacterium]|jgi:hypothetical protein